MKGTSEAGRFTPPPGKTMMTDHLHLVNQLAHHDAAISAFGSRMTAVESTLGHVQDKLSNVDSRMQSGFAEVSGLIKESRAQQGPGMSETVKLAVAACSLVALSSAAIMFLVNSGVEPKLRELTLHTQKLGELRARDEDQRSRELEKLREDEKSDLETSVLELRRTVDEMQTSKNWNQVIIKKGGT